MSRKTMLQRRMEAVTAPACVHWDPAGQDKVFLGHPIPSHLYFHPQPTLLLQAVVREEGAPQ